jgi:hypothetical protein
MNQAKGHGEKRSRKQEQFIAALLSNSTVEAAAKVVGIGNVTAWKWRKDPAPGSGVCRAVPGGHP